MVNYLFLTILLILFHRPLECHSATVFYQSSSTHGEIEDGPEVWIFKNETKSMMLFENKPNALGEPIDYAGQRILETLGVRFFEANDNSYNVSDSEDSGKTPDVEEGESNDEDNESATEMDYVKEHKLMLDFQPNMTREQVHAIQGQIMSRNMNWSVDPCEDFYEFACGNWNNHNSMPDDATGYDTFEKLRDQLNFVLRSLLEEEADHQVDSESVVKAKHLYESCMNLARVEERKESPLLKLLQDLGGWPILSSTWKPSGDLHWLDLMARLRLFNNDILASMWVAQDAKNPEQHVITFDQGDLGLPNREYYLSEGNVSSILIAYGDFIRGAAYELGAPEDVVDNDIVDLIQFEIELAKILIPAEERRNYSAMYRKMTIDEFDEMSSIPWSRFLSIILGRHMNESDTIVVYASDYFPKLASLVQRTDSRTLTNYILWRFVRHRLNNLDQRFQDLKQDLYAVLYGRKKQPERWKYCVLYVNGHMGMAVGSLFVRNFFSEESKNDTTRMTSEIHDIFSHILEVSDWLDDGTKYNAKQKLHSMNYKVGYPDYILEKESLDAEYEEVQVGADSYFENVLGLLRHSTREELKRLNRTVDRNQWVSNPAVINAYYSRSRNQIMLPAGILQPPFYHPMFPRALNYGGIGVVIGHEITHGFDDQGRQFDLLGNLQPWWSDDSVSNFHDRTQCIIDQYNNYTVPEIDMPVNGVNTQGENIADNGGIRQSFQAYEKWLRETPQENQQEFLPGLNITSNKLFFLHFAQMWCGTLRPQAAISKVRTAVHAPRRFRVIGSLSNLAEFSTVFQCPKGSRMNPEKRCAVW